MLDLTLNGSATIESEGYPDYNYGNDTFQYWLFAAAKWGPRTRIDVRELETQRKLRLCFQSRIHSSRFGFG